MTPENTRKLFSAFPSLYRGKDKGLEQSLMSWGFECGDGWFDLVWKLSSGIEAAARMQGIDPHGEDWPEATRVKEKFGTLRFHVRHASDEIRKLIDAALEESARICEICGAPARLEESRTLCERHYGQPGE